MAYNMKREPAEQGPEGKQAICLAGIYPTELTDEKTGEVRKLERWYFKYVDPQHEGKQACSPLVNPNASSEKSTLYKMVKLLLGTVPDVVEPDDLIGVAGYAHLSKKSNGYNDLVFFERDEDLTAKVKQQMQAKAKQQAEQEAEVPF